MVDGAKFEPKGDGCYTTKAMNAFNQADLDGNGKIDNPEELKILNSIFGESTFSLTDGPITEQSFQDKVPKLLCDNDGLLKKLDAVPEPKVPEGKDIK